MSISELFPSDDRRMRPKVASAAAALSVVILVAVVWMGLAAGAARGATATNVTFKQDVISRSPLPWPTDNCSSASCSQRVQIEFIDRSGGFRPPLDVREFQSVDLGAVESFEVTDSYQRRDSSFSYFYFVSVHGGEGPLTLTLTELHRRSYSSAFRVDVRCRRWEPSTGSVPVSC
jgi:hypothetical protein